MAPGNSLRTSGIRKSRDIGKWGRGQRIGGGRGTAGIETFLYVG